MPALLVVLGCGRSRFDAITDGSTGGSPDDGAANGELVAVRDGSALLPDGAADGAAADAPVGGCAPITTMIAQGGVPSLSWTGAELGVAYMAGASRPTQPSFVRVGVDGGVIGASAVLAVGGTPMTFQPLPEIAAAWNGAGWGVAWPTRRGVSTSRGSTPAAPRSRSSS
jgi:hypothetical protein